MALLLPFLALALQWALWPWIKPFVWFLFFPTVFFSASLGGLLGGLGSTVLCTGIVWYFFIPPQLSWAMANPSNFYSVGLFLVMGYLFSDAHERLHRARRGTEMALAQIRADNAYIVKQANAIASGDYSADVTPRSDQDELGIALRAMNAALRVAHQEGIARDWLKTGVARLNDAMRGELAIDRLATQVISEMTRYLGAQVGILYLAQEGEPPTLTLVGSYAYTRRGNLPSEFRLGEGLVGQAALDQRQILIDNVPEDYIRVTSGLGERVPRCLCLTPFSHEGRLKGVVEIGTLNAMGPSQLDYLQQAMPTLAVVIESAQIRLQMARALEESQQLTEELRVSNEELEFRTNKSDQ